MDIKFGFRKYFTIFIVTAILIACIFCGVVTACNYQVIDLTYGFDYAYIKLPNGEIIEGNVESWRDYEDGDQIQVTINGKTYLVHASNCTLVSNNYYEEAKND